MGKTEGDSGSSGDKKAKKYAEQLNKIAIEEYEKREPLMDMLINKAESFMNTGDIGSSQYFAPVKNAVEDQMALAQNRAIETMPVGGGMNEAIGNIFAQGGASLLDNLITKELDNAFTIGMGGTPIALSGLGGAGQIATGVGANQANRYASEMGAMSNTVSSGIGGMSCCFIFIAGHGFLHPVVRRYRDSHMTVRNRRGYYWLSDRLVPQMEKRAWVRRIVKLVMVDPMTSYGKYYYGLNRIGAIFAPITKAWLTVFTLLGLRKPYTRRGTSEVA